MLLLNFAHPLTPDQMAQVTALVGEAPDVRVVPVQADRRRALADVVRDLVDSVGLSATEWQMLPLIVNPPGLAPLALALLAECHGRCSYFPAIVNVRPIADTVPTQYEVAEVINLQAVRDQARERRVKG
jgi:hypothetical protein